MLMQTISFKIDERKKERIDHLATLQDRNRSYLINEALDRYLDIMEWQLDHITEAVKQADQGVFASEEEVQAAFAKWKA